MFEICLTDSLVSAEGGCWVVVVRTITLTTIGDVVTR